MRTPKLKVKGILLDLDGTLVDSKGAYFEAARTALTKLGQETIEARMIFEIPRRLEQSLPISDLIKGIDTQEFLDIYLDAYYRATTTRAVPILGASEALRKLSEKAKLGLITMRYISAKKVIKELERFGLAKYFQHVVTALDTHNPKPSPEAAIKCARRLGIKIYECAVVGDSVLDVRAGKNAGAITVAVLSGIFSREELEREKPDLILENVKELPDFLE